MGAQGRVWTLRLLPAGGKRWGSLGLGNPFPLVFGEQTGWGGVSGALLPGGLRSEQQGTPNTDPSRTIGILLPEDNSEVWDLLWDFGGVRR